VVINAPRSAAPFVETRISSPAVVDVRETGPLAIKVKSFATVEEPVTATPDVVLVSTALPEFAVTAPLEIVPTAVRLMSEAGAVTLPVVNEPALATVMPLPLRFPAPRSPVILVKLNAAPAVASPVKMFEPRRLSVVPALAEAPPAMVPIAEMLVLVPEFSVA
jgi:hypothetical protein